LLLTVINIELVISILSHHYKFLLCDTNFFLFLSEASIRIHVVIILCYLQSGRSYA